MFVSIYYFIKDTFNIVQSHESTFTFFPTSKFSCIESSLIR